MAAAPALLAKQEGRYPVQPINASSHWYHGDAAGRSCAADIRHTLLGFATHHAASVFWAALFEALRRRYPKRSPALDALGVSALAAAVDYGLVPKRLTPGWEEVVSPRTIMLACAAMALGLMATRSRGR